MKRGLINWDKTEIPPEVFKRRVNDVRHVLSDRKLPAMVVYSDLWRSNPARFFSNFMPYFNRALLIIPRDMPLTLLCGLSPRVYGWIRSVTTIDDVRPAGNFAKPLFDIAAERQWRQIGVLDLDRLPFDIYTAVRGGSLDVISLPADTVFLPAADETEFEMRHKTARLTMEILEQEMAHGVGLVDHHFVGRLERRFRRAGAEDLIVLLTNGKTPPAPACGTVLEQQFSVSVAVEYRGHWVRISRPRGVTATANTAPRFYERLDGSYPYECGAGRIMAEHVELELNGKRLFFGNTLL